VSGVHDLGGGEGHGAVEPEPDEPPFHAAWEGRVLAVHVALGAGGVWSLDEFRFARERLAPDAYLGHSYYDTVLEAIERLATDHGLVTPDELAAGRSLDTGGPAPRPVSAADIGDVLRKGRPSQRVGPRIARFGSGDPVRARTVEPVTHTRLPRYVRGHVGVVTDVHGCHVFPDARAQGGGDDPQWLYTVRFAGPELWGPATDPTLSVSIDAFESYLESTC
jgi:nitrile hydratase beta subunit